jgi:hypothetical protein
MAIYSLDKTENFIIKSKKVKRKNNVIYDYSETRYNHSQQPVVIVCPIHGRFEQLPSIHLSGGGCPKCFGRNKTTEDFIKEATIIQKEKNGDTYNYKKTIFISSRQPVKITCFVHGDFEQTPKAHLKGGRCLQCFYASQKYTTEEFIARAKIYQKEKNDVVYDYCDTVYTGARNNVIITCFVHGKFEQTPDNHLHGQGCPYCAKISRNISKSSNIKDFTEKLIYFQKHEIEYNYNKSVYKNNYTKIIITCPIHGDFMQTPQSHLSGAGCPRCKESTGEKSIRKYLKENNFSFDDQFTFADCKYKYVLRFDFVLFNENKTCNALIEYQGRQHFESIEYWNGIEGLKTRQAKDKIKFDYCQRNNIPLLIIHYKDFKKISDLLSEFINTLNIRKQINNIEGLYK